MKGKKVEWEWYDNRVVQIGAHQRKILGGASYKGGFVRNEYTIPNDLPIVISLDLPQRIIA